MPYKVVIMLLGSLYEKYRNAIRYEELKGNIEIVAIGDITPYARTLDGWRLCTTEEALVRGFDYLIMSQGMKETEEAARTFAGIGIDPEHVLSIEIFSSVCFDFCAYIRLHHAKPSIIAQNCWGGFTYHALHLRFRSPFINMFMEEDDYLRLLSDLRGNLELPLKEDRDSEEAAKNAYPVAYLGDVQLHLNHYKSFEEAEVFWNRRKERINWDNLFVMMYTARKENAMLFESLPFEKKVVFTPYDLGAEHQICLSDYNEWLEDVEKDLWRNVNGVANGTLQYYDPIRLLNGDEDFYRIVK